MIDPDSEVLYFSGAHCPVCRRLTPRVQAVADRFHGRVDLIEIDVAGHPDMVAKHSVRAVPTLVGIHDGVVVGRAVGAQSPAAITEFFAGAAAGDLRPLSPAAGERMMRLGAAIAIGAIGFVASQPLLLAAAASLAGYAFGDRIPLRWPARTDTRHPA